MRTRTSLCAAATLAVLTASLSATNYSLWINGRGGGGQVGNHADFSYWGPAASQAGVNKKSVNWDGYNRIADTNAHIRNALDCYCTGPNWCYIAAHSAGNLQIGYALDFYGVSARSKKNPTPNASGVCTNSDGTTQTGWNIKWVDIAGGAGGGSELANSGDWALSEPLVSDLKTGTARALYNHNNTRGAIFYMFAAAKGTLYSFVLPGQDDEAVAYHSSGGVSGTGGGSYCNPADWFCNDLTLGTSAAQGGRAKWTNHSVKFRDDGESVNHYAGGNWGGIVGKVRADMETNAK
ncbi:MAG TPA: hypothetical protein VFQ20_00220 [Burkholderiaceae bacterium]|nr:hypothetical protein [Burkholderiaceae bacterium]